MHKQKPGDVETQGRVEQMQALHLHPRRKENRLPRNQQQENPPPQPPTPLHEQKHGKHLPVRRDPQRDESRTSARTPKLPRTLPPQRQDRQERPSVTEQTMPRMHEHDPKPWPLRDTPHRPRGTGREARTGNLLWRARGSTQTITFPPARTLKTKGRQQHGRP